MTWIGKILSVFVLILSVAAMWFITTVFVARTNWKNDRDAWKNLYKEAESARVAELTRYATEKQSLQSQLAAERTSAKELAGQIATLTGANDKINEDYKRMTATLQNADIKAVELQALLQASTDEVKKTRDRNVVLENERVVLATAKENAERDRQAFANQVRQANSDKQLAEARLEGVNSQLAELRASGGDPSKVVPNSFARPPAPLPDNIRGTVTAYSDGYVSLNIGIDAGLTNGAKLDIFRSTGDGKYLGTVTVERVYPKQAVAKFKSADGRALTRLRPEELPRVRDTVGKIGTSGPLSLKP